MIAPVDVARLALRRAVETRRRASVSRDAALCVYDLAEAAGIEVRFVALDSLAGMYSRPPSPVILIGSCRPAGYRAMTCGHELGHHVFGHGDRVDEYIGGRERRSSEDPEEQLANMFGYFLLMPEAAVIRAFISRGWDPATPTVQQAFTVAGHLGVGYEALIQHMRWSLRRLSRERAEALLQVRPCQIRLELLGHRVAEDVYVVDDKWTDRPVDLAVGDYVILPAGALVEGDGAAVVERTRNRVLGRAVRRGLARLELPDQGWSAYIRVMGRGFTGLAVHRHLEDPDADE